MTNDIRRVTVVGAGIAGLMSALALAREGVEVDLFERDTSPPNDIAPADSMRWARKGVPQSLHPHFYMGRLRMLLEDRYPELVERLVAAGASENSLADYVDPELAARLTPRETDVQLRSLGMRRPTFEMTIREYAQSRPGIRIHDNTRVADLLIDRTAAGAPIVRGLRLETADGPREQPGDVVIDASGRFSKVAGALDASGVPMQIEQRDAGLVYMTRHYRLREGASAPPAAGLPGARFPDFILGALPADNGAFTVTFQVYRHDTDIIRALRDPAHFHAMCLRVGAVAPWVQADRSLPTSDVYGFGKMDSFWRRTVVDGQPQVLGLYFVGDSCVRSNPKFGRGCTWSAVAAHHLADLLVTDLTPAERIVRYENALEREFRNDWETMLAIDRGTEAAFEVAAGQRSATLAERASAVFERVVDTALVTEPEVFREVWAGYHGVRGMSNWIRVPRVWPRLARAAFTAARAAVVSDTSLAPGSVRPSRAELSGGTRDHPVPAFADVQ